MLRRQGEKTSRLSRVEMSAISIHGLDDGGTHAACWKYALKELLSCSVRFVLKGKSKRNYRKYRNAVSSDFHVDGF